MNNLKRLLCIQTKQPDFLSAGSKDINGIAIHLDRINLMIIYLDNTLFEPQGQWMRFHVIPVQFDSTLLHSNYNIQTKSRQEQQYKANNTKF